MCGRNVHNTRVRSVPSCLALAMNYFPSLFAFGLITAAIFPYLHLYLPMLTLHYRLGHVSIFYLGYCYLGIFFTASLVYLNFFKAILTCPGYVPHAIWQHTPLLSNERAEERRFPSVRYPPESNRNRLPAGTKVRFGPPPATSNATPTPMSRNSPTSPMPRSGHTGVDTETCSPNKLPPELPPPYAGSTPLLPQPNHTSVFEDVYREAPPAVMHAVPLEQHQPLPGGVGTNTPPEPFPGVQVEGVPQTILSTQLIQYDHPFFYHHDEKLYTKEKSGLSPGSEVTDGVVNPPRNPYRVDLSSQSCLRFCRYCDQYKPDRAYHCHTCKQCIFNMDHHCPWINNCVGRDNTKFFLLFTFYIPVGGAHIFLTMLYTVLRRDEQLRGYRFSIEDDANVVTVLYYLVGMLEIAAMAFVFGGFSARFWCLLWKGETSISEMIADRTGISNGPGRPHRNEDPQSAQDRYRTLIFGLDRRWWVVLLPFRPIRPAVMLLDGTVDPPASLSPWPTGDRLLPQQKAQHELEEVLRTSEASAGVSSPSHTTTTTTELVRGSATSSTSSAASLGSGSGIKQRLSALRSRLTPSPGSPKSFPVTVEACADSHMV